MGLELEEEALRVLAGLADMRGLSLEQLIEGLLREAVSEAERQD